jgi:hypothetical protein
MEKILVAARYRVASQHTRFALQEDWLAAPQTDWRAFGRSQFEIGATNPGVDLNPSNN